MPETSNHQARYLVGIDLGTTHTVVAYTDTDQSGKTNIDIFNIEQLTAPGEITSLPLLPSVRYHPAVEEMAEVDTRLPWNDDDEETRPVIGELARILGSKTHGRTITSAKSWLSHGAVDRNAPILPWGAAEGISKISPVEASASYLAYVRAAWNRAFPGFPLEIQEIVVTVPASFDEAARSLTIDAAHKAGLPKIRLLEEPQAACYDWVWHHRKTLSDDLHGVRLLLVVDVGGGTTDLTLIKVEPGKKEPKLVRIGVGDHLMLGGDNLDLTLAHIVEQRLSSAQRLRAAELSQIVEQCRQAKEKLLGDNAPASASVTLLGSGSKLIGGARSTEFERDTVCEVVLDGFFPMTDLHELPDRKRSGVVEFGLPYAPDPAISKHIAAFLHQHRLAMTEALGDDGLALPDAVLLNGGMFLSPVITERLLALLGSWRKGSSLHHLRNDRPDQAVAHGAVAYGLARRGLSVGKIGGGSARTYFLLIDAESDDVRQGICLLPRGSEEGMEIVLAERSFALTLGVPVRFHLVASVADNHWKPGDIVDIDGEQFTPLPPLAAALDRESQGREEVIVRLAASLTEMGALKIQCIDATDSDRRWNVEFQLRQYHFAPQVFSQNELPSKAAEAVDLIRMVFGKKSRTLDSKQVKGLRNDLEKMLGRRETWDPPLLRELFAALLEGMPHRRRSEVHERVWLSLTGYCLRPGFGYPLDDWRVEQIWSIYESGIQHQNESQNWTEWWTLWRRIAGGLNVDAQSKLFAAVADFINPDKAKRGNLPVLAKKRGYEDMLRLSAVLERLPLGDKTLLGGWLLSRLNKPNEPAEVGWALGRVGARIPFHVGMDGVVPRETVEAWLSTIFDIDWKKVTTAGFAATLLARMTGDRERDVGTDMRAKVIERLRIAKAPESWMGMVKEVKELDEADEKRIFGEALPPGLKLLG